MDVTREWDEAALVEALVRGEEEAFLWLVHRYWPSMKRVAGGLLRSDNVAEEVVQETFEAVFKEIARFRGESSLRTWMFRILVNRARRVGKREARSIPFSGLGRQREEPRRDAPEDEFTSRGHWSSPVHGWRMVDPQSEAISRQGVQLLAEHLEDLPERQRTIVTLRDVEGLSSKEVCKMLDISEGNQRVLLHRGRTALRRALESDETRLSDPGARA